MSGTFTRPKRAFRRLTLPHNWDQHSREILSRGEVSGDIPTPEGVDPNRVRRTLTKLKALRWNCEDEKSKGGA